MSAPSLRTLRRRAATHGYRIWKVRRGSDLYWDYGPYTLVDNNMVALQAVGLEEMAAFLDRPTECQETVVSPAARRAVWSTLRAWAPHAALPDSRGQCLTQRSYPDPWETHTL